MRFRPYSRSASRVVGKKKQKKSFLRGKTSFFGLFSFFLLYEEYTERGGSFKSRPVSLAPTLRHAVFSTRLYIHTRTRPAGEIPVD